MMIPWWEHSEKGVTDMHRQTDTDRHTDRRTDRQTETDRKTDSNFFKRKVHLKMLSAKCWPFFSGLNIGLFDAHFFIKVYHQPKLKREIVHISKFQNKILYQSKKKYLIHSQLHQSACRIPNESQGCAQTFFIISYQTLAQCMCQSSTPIHYMYNLHNILYKISYN